MLGLIVSWAVSAAALMLAGNVFDNVKLKGDFADALWVAAIYAILSKLFHWLLFVMLGFASLGLGFVFSLVTNLIAAALVLKMTSALSRRFKIEGFMPAVGTAILLALGAELTGRLLS